MTVLPPHGLLALPTPLDKPATPIAEAVKWDASHVTDRVDFSKGVKVEWLDRREDADRLSAVSAMWGSPLARVRKGPEHRMPRSTRRQLHSLEALHEHRAADVPASLDRTSPTRVSPERQASHKKKHKRSKNAVSGEDEERGEGGHGPGGEAGTETQVARRFTPKGEGMELSVESVQVKGLDVKVGTAVEVEVYVGKNIGAEAHKVSLSRKKVVTSQVCRKYAASFAVL